MTIVSGYITTITGEPSNTLSVSVRADRTRPSASGVTTAEPQIVSWDSATGELIFTAEPGAAVITLSMGTRLESIPISVPDAETATLEEVVSEKFIIPPPVVNRGLDQIEAARDDAVQEIEGKFDESMHGWLQTETAREGMGLLWDGAAFRWSWLDQFKDTYVDDH